MLWNQALRLEKKIMLISAEHEILNADMCIKI